MTWVVDTCVLLDLACNDKTFAGCASQAIQLKMDDVLTIAPLTYVELAPQFLGNAARQDEFLRSLWIECDFDLRKRAGKVAKRPIADIMIGAYAMRKGGLITRNEDDFRSLFPNLTIFNPVAMAT